MPNYYTEPKVSVLARPVFAEPAHLPVHWTGESTDGERLAEFAGRLCYMSQKNPANRSTRDYLENIKKQGHGSVLEHASYSLLLEGVSRSLTHELVRHGAGGCARRAAQFHGNQDCRQGERPRLAHHARTAFERGRRAGDSPPGGDGAANAAGRGARLLGGFRRLHGR